MSLIIWPIPSSGNTNSNIATLVVLSLAGIGQIIREIY